MKKQKTLYQNLIHDRNKEIKKIKRIYKNRIKHKNKKTADRLRDERDKMIFDIKEKSTNKWSELNPNLIKELKPVHRVNVVEKIYRIKITSNTDRAIHNKMNNLFKNPKVRSIILSIGGIDIETDEPVNSFISDSYNKENFERIVNKGKKVFNDMLSNISTRKSGEFFEAKFVILRVIIEI